MCIGWLTHKLGQARPKMDLISELTQLCIQTASGPKWLGGAKSIQGKLTLRLLFPVLTVRSKGTFELAQTDQSINQSINQSKYKHMSD